MPKNSHKAMKDIIDPVELGVDLEQGSAPEAQKCHQERVKRETYAQIHCLLVYPYLRAKGLSDLFGSPLLNDRVLWGKKKQ